jgi:hypothetical protein
VQNITNLVCFQTFSLVFEMERCLFFAILQSVFWNLSLSFNMIHVVLPFWGGTSVIKVSLCVSKRVLSSGFVKMSLVFAVVITYFKSKFLNS